MSILERLLPSDSIQGGETFDKINAVIDEVNRMNKDPHADPSLWRPMDRDPKPQTEAERRKTYPLYSGLLKYFPDALAEVAHLSKVGNDQHNPGQPLHWDRAKSQDQLDALMRHLKDHTTNPIDTDGELHLTKVVWRALAELQLVLEGLQAKNKAKVGFIDWESGKPLD